MAALLSRAWGGLTGGLGARVWGSGWLRVPGAAPAASMSFWKSAAVRKWVEGQPRQDFQREPWEEGGKVMSPRLSRRKQAQRIKEAIRLGEIRLEPTVMTDPPKFKGHKCAQPSPSRKRESGAQHSCHPHRPAPMPPPATHISDRALCVSAPKLSHSPSVLSPSRCRRERDRPIRLATIDQKMKEMPKLIAEYRESRRAMREKRRLEDRFK